jgi:hypothetical protein
VKAALIDRLKEALDLEQQQAGEHCGAEVLFECFLSQIKICNNLSYKVA